MSDPFLGFNNPEDEFFVEKLEDDEDGAFPTAALFELGVLVMSKELEWIFSGSPILVKSGVGPEDRLDSSGAIGSND